MDDGPEGAGRGGVSRRTAGIRHRGPFARRKPVHGALGRFRTISDDPGRSGTTSSGGTFSFQFQAAKPGKAIVELSYGKTASAYSRPERTFTVTIEVK